MSDATQIRDPAAPTNNPAAAVQGTFPHHWQATVLRQRPLILPRRHYVYPREAEEVERGALELLVTPAGADPFLATCALGFADPLAPTGVWTCPNPIELCAVAGGYAYLINTQIPEHFEEIPYRPVYAVHPAPEAGLLLFVGNQSILAYSAAGCAWQSPHLSDEGLAVHSIKDGRLNGAGWQMQTDEEISFTLDLMDGHFIPNTQAGTPEHLRARK